MSVYILPAQMPQAGEVVRLADGSYARVERYQAERIYNDEYRVTLNVRLLPDEPERVKWLIDEPAK